MSNSETDQKLDNDISDELLSVETETRDSEMTEEVTTETVEAVEVTEG